MKRVDYCIYFVFALLGAHFANAEWVCAQDGEKFESGGSDSIQINDYHDPPTNCTYDAFEVSDGYYFEVRAGNSYSDVDVAVGVATGPASEGVVAPLQGFFYNDDLFDGNGKTLQEHFGDKVKPVKNNDYGTVGVLVKRNEEEVTLYLLHDRVPLGPALKISNPGSVLYPAVLVGGEATIQYLSTETSTLPDNPQERSGDIINNYFRVTSLNGDTETPLCSDERIRLWPVDAHELKTKYNDDSQTVSFYVSFIPGDADNTVGYLAKNEIFAPQWEWNDLDKENDDSQRSECLKFVKSVFVEISSFKLGNSRITASSKTGKSFEAVKSEFPTVPQMDFENSG